MSPVSTALISVYDKGNLVEFCQGLKELDIRLLASEGTSVFLAEHGIEAVPLSQITGFTQLLEGRVKSLHPAVFAAILARRSSEDDLSQLTALSVPPIDLVVVNFYPFGETMELVDIGGPALVRAAAKNHQEVAVVVDPADYNGVLAELRETGGISLETRVKLAAKAFEVTSSYDTRIADSLGRPPGEKGKFPEVLSFRLSKAYDLRYGENPHQQAAFYKTAGLPFGMAAAKLHQGKELSYNNLLDLESALAAVCEFEGTAAVIVKHNSPCGVALSSVSIADAYRKARRCDPVSAFGGVIALNRAVDVLCAEEIINTFMEAVIAPEFQPGALKIFKKRKGMRVVELSLGQCRDGGMTLRGLSGGLLLQEPDWQTLDEKKLKVVTSRAPSDEEMEGMKFAWKVCKHVRSNAIVYALKDRVVGIGAGQMSRVDAALVGLMKAKEGTRGTVAASDAFFPFRDAVDTIAQAGVTAVIQPGGSVNDKEVIRAADENGLAMVFTGIRHFKH